MPLSPSHHVLASWLISPLLQQAMLCSVTVDTCINHDVPINDHLIVGSKFLTSLQTPQGGSSSFIRLLVGSPQRVHKSSSVTRYSQDKHHSYRIRILQGQIWGAGHLSTSPGPQLLRGFSTLQPELPKQGGGWKCRAVLSTGNFCSVGNVVWLSCPLVGSVYWPLEMWWV